MIEETTVVNIKHPNAGLSTYIGRGSPFGNPYSHLPNTKAVWRVNSRGEAIAKYRTWFITKVRTDAIFLKKVLDLRGKKLGCFCHPLPCHGEIIVEFLKFVEHNNFRKFV